MFILIFIHIVITKRITLFQELILNDKCIIGTIQQFHSLQYKLNLTLSLHSHITENNCIPLQEYVQISETYTYGNWCGKNHGGFSNQCKEICLKHSYPTQECQKCLPPIDWVDTQCMYHDFCIESFQLSNQDKNHLACSSSINLGNPFPSPCSCAQNLTHFLRPNFLHQRCNSVVCQLNGDIIHDFFDSSLMKCSCYYQVCNNNTIDEDGNPVQLDEKVDCWNRSACVQVDQCSALGGK